MNRSIFATAILVGLLAGCDRPASVVVQPPQSPPQSPSVVVNPTVTSPSADEAKAAADKAAAAANDASRAAADSKDSAIDARSAANKATDTVNKN